MNRIIRRIQPFAIAAIFALATVASTTAWAGTDDKSELKFLGFGTNPDFYAVQLSDELSGKTVMIYQIGTPTPLVAVSLEGTSLKKALAGAQLSPYAIQQEGHTTGATAPAGFTLVGTEVGAQFQLDLAAGEQKVTIGYSPIATDPAGMKYAKVKMKEVHWNADSTRVVIIMNQKLKGEWPMDSDTHAAFKLQAAQ